MGTLQGLIDRELAEEGYIEKASNKDLDSKISNKGDGNFTKFSRDVNAWGLNGCQGQPWCCTMQFAVESYEFGVEAALEHWNMTKSTYVGFNCFATYNAFKKAGKIGTIPKLGAVVIFNFSHAGRVVKIYSKNGQQWFDCLEGNTSANLSDRNGGQVKLKTRPFNDSSVKGFCYIDYSKYDKHYTEGFLPAADGNRWWYQYRDGSFAHSGWYWLTETTTGTSGWYLFDGTGYMLTGYQKDSTDASYFLCHSKGVNEGKCMVTDGRGVLQIAKQYDFVNHRFIL